MFQLKNGEPVTEFKYRGSHVIDERTGEINAYDRREAMQQIGRLIQAAASGEIKKKKSIDSSRVRNLVVAAASDPTGPAWKALGEAMAEEIAVTMDRQGFSRRILAIKDLEQGESAEVPIKQKDVIGWMMTSDAQTPRSIVRQKFIVPEEFYLEAYVEIEVRDLARSPVDLLDSKYNDALEQIMVAEDRVFKILADRAATTSNELVLFTTFTPAVFANLMNQITDWNLPCVSAIIANDIWTDIMASNDFASYFDPVSKYNLILEGRLGTLFGVELITDAFREPNLKVLNKGEVYFCSSPKTLGIITRRQDVTSKPIDGATVGRPVQGWYLYAVEGMVIANSRGIAKGVRI